MSKGPGRSGTRVGRIRDWLGRQTDSGSAGSRSSGSNATCRRARTPVPRRRRISCSRWCRPRSWPSQSSARPAGTRMPWRSASSRVCISPATPPRSCVRPSARRKQHARGDGCRGDQLPLLGHRDRSALSRRLHARVAGGDGSGERPGAVHDLVLRDLRAPRGHVRGDDRDGVVQPRALHPALARCSRSSTGSGRRASCCTRRCRRGGSCRGPSSEPSCSAARSVQRRSGWGRR